MSDLTPQGNNHEFHIKSFEDIFSMIGDFVSNSFAGITGGTFRLDVQEREREYQIEAELPGIRKEEINIQLVDGSLVIAVNRQKASEGKNYLYQERSYTSMQRSIYLPGARAENIRARLEGGVLIINIPKDDKLAIARRIVIE